MMQPMCSSSYERNALMGATGRSHCPRFGLGVTTLSQISHVGYSRVYSPASRSSLKFKSSKSFWISKDIHSVPETGVYCQARMAPRAPAKKVRQTYSLQQLFTCLHKKYHLMNIIEFLKDGEGCIMGLIGRE